MPKTIQPPTPMPDFDTVAWIEKTKAWRNPLGVCVENSELPHPDGELLEIASLAILNEKKRDLCYRFFHNSGGIEALKEVEADLSKLLRRARKLKAETPAGLFAKAQLVRRSKTGAALLAKSLADDMIEMPGLRQLIWPAEVL